MCFRSPLKLINFSQWYSKIKYTYSCYLLGHSPAARLTSYSSVFWCFAWCRTRIKHYDYLAINWTIIPGSEHGAHWMHNLNLPLHSILIGILLILSPPIPHSTAPLLLGACSAIEHGRTWSAARDANCARATSPLAVAQKSTNVVWYNNTFPLLSSLHSHSHSFLHFGHLIAFVLRS